MLRNPQCRLVVTFYTTADAMKTELVAQETGLTGRLIPVPQILSAGCGLAWSAPPDTEIALRAALERAKIMPQFMTQLMI